MLVPRFSPGCFYFHPAETVASPVVVAKSKSSSKGQDRSAQEFLWNGWRWKVEGDGGRGYVRDEVGEWHEDMAGA